MNARAVLTLKSGPKKLGQTEVDLEQAAGMNKSQKICIRATYNELLSK